MAAAAPGPPCATCGAPLSWLGERNAWACVRCEQPSPYAPSAAPHAKYSPFRPPPPPEEQAAAIQMQIYAAAPTGKRMWIAIAGAVGLLVIVAIAFAAAGGGGVGSGAPSREELVKRTLRAIGKRDGDALVGLADPIGLMARIIDCKDKPAKDDEDRDPDVALRKARDRYERFVRDLPELTLDLVELRDERGDAKPLIDKGDKMMKGCVAKIAIYLREAKAVVRVARAGERGREQTIEIAMIEADGRFYLSEPPKLEVGDSDDYLDHARELKDKMCACRDKACGERVRDEFARLDATSKARHLTDDDAKRSADISRQYSNCYMKLVMANLDVPDASTTDIPEAPADMASECVEYRRLVVKYTRCDGVVQSSRDAVKSTWAGMVQTWPLATAASRSSMTDACRDSARILRQGIDRMCL